MFTMPCRDGGREAVDDDEFGRTLLTGKRGSAGIIRTRRILRPRDKEYTTSMPALAAPVSSPSADANPAEILSGTGVPGGEQEGEPTALALQAREPRLLQRCAARKSGPDVAREMARIWARTGVNSRTVTRDDSGASR